MLAKKPTITQLKNYTPPDFLINSVHLFFDLQEERTVVKTVLAMKRNPKVKTKRPLVLNGVELSLQSLLINGANVPDDNYKVDKEYLTIFKVPTEFTLETEVIINPKANTQLMGLYVSRGNFCTQCEAEGFRRITYFLDRPDVMTHFTTTIAADKKYYPLLLSNGNLVEQKELSDGRHWVKWEDPSLKPCYLFALVAGDFEWIEDEFVTRSGRSITLRVFIEKGKRNQADFAMECVHRAMRWDEEKFGREYDLDIFMIVAVSDFNMGAMENKGLNVFNDRYILVRPETATDTDFINVESVIGHEYFHNWTGNRITCRNWFQITLKEGLTIFRDQSFTADLHSATVSRIGDVEVIRTAQFAQDASPLAHSIRPDSYMKIDNFYTVTVYNKGSEVIRMMQTILGKEKFRRAMDIYFDRYDGQAVTTEEFVRSMETAGRISLKQFRCWYTQAGTPQLHVTTKYNAKQKTYFLTVKQMTPATPGQPRKQPFYIPLAIGLLDSNGKELLNPTTKILIINKKTQQFKFKKIASKPIVSLLRDFSAPVKLNYAYSDEELLFLMKHDSDGFNRWDAGQKLATKYILNLVIAYQKKRTLILPREYITAMQRLLQQNWDDLELLSAMLTLPSMMFLIGAMPVADVDALHAAREFMKKEIAKQLQALWMETYEKYNNNERFNFTEEAIGKRSVKNLSLYYLAQLQQSDIRLITLQQFQQADNMTDVMGSLQALNNANSEERELALQQFYHKWQHDDLVVNKWFAVQAMAPMSNTLATVKKLLSHPAFSYTNPNKVRSLIGVFSQANYVNFHKKDGSGYKFLADQIIKLDKINSHTSARLVEPFTRWQKFDKARQQLMKQQLIRIKKTPKISLEIYELVTKSLGGK